MWCVSCVAVTVRRIAKQARGRCRPTPGDLCDGAVPLRMAGMLWPSCCAQTLVTNAKQTKATLRLGRKGLENPLFHKSSSDEARIITLESDSLCPPDVDGEPIISP